MIPKAYNQPENMQPTAVLLRGFRANQTDTLHQLKLQIEGKLGKSAFFSLLPHSSMNKTQIESSIFSHVVNPMMNHPQYDHKWVMKIIPSHDRFAALWHLLGIIWIYRKETHQSVDAQGSLEEVEAWPRQPSFRIG